MFIFTSHLCTPFKKECTEFPSSVSGTITEFHKIFIGISVIKKNTAFLSGSNFWTVCDIMYLSPQTHKKIQSVY